VLGIRCDGEGAVEAMRPELSLRKIPIETAAADEHVAELKRAHQTKILIVSCVLFCIYLASTCNPEEGALMESLRSRSMEEESPTRKST